MVGMVIGMFGIIVMMQVFALSEERKRTSTSGGDAMTEGVMALYALQRDILQSGYGIGDVKVLGCNVLLRAGVTLNAMAPVTINHASIPAGDTNTDTLLVAYGNTNGSPQGDQITAQTGSTYAVQTATSFASNDYVIAAPPTRVTPCALTLDRVVTSLVAPNVTVTTGVAGMAGGTLFNLGLTPTIAAYAIRSGNLTMCDYTANDCSAAGSTGNAAVWVPIANNIVSLRAQYGRDTTTPMDGIVNTYDQTTPTTACGWAQTSAVRLVVVSRSAQYEKAAVTAAAPTWDGSAVGTTTPTNPTAVPINLAAVTGWQNYRYKVFQTVVPMRNVAWMGTVTGC